jgi:hypothetical protein
MPRFGITATELGQLVAIDAERLDITAGGIRRARTRALRRLFATTFGCYGDRVVAAASEFLAADIPLASTDEATRSLDTGRRFVDHLRAVGDPAAELARLELLRAELLLLPEAASAASQAEAGVVGVAEASVACEAGAPPGDWLLRLGGHVRVAEFSMDVLAIRPGQDPDECVAVTPAYVLLSRRAAPPSVRLIRITQTAFRLFSRCDGTRSVADLLTGLTGPAGPAAEIVELIKFGLAERLLATSASSQQPAEADPTGVTEEKSTRGGVNYARYRDCR